MTTEKEMIDQLKRGKISLPPLSLRLMRIQPETGDNRRFDAFIEVSWQGSSASFAVEIKSIWTPKVFQNTLNFLKSSSLP